MTKLISRELYLFQSRIATHVVFWVSYYIFFSLLWAQDGNLFESFQLEFILMPVRIAASYISLYFLIPKYLEKERTEAFAIWYSVLIVIGGVVQRVLTFYFHELLFVEEGPMFGTSSVIRSIVLVNSTVMLLSAMKLYKLWIGERHRAGITREEPLEIRSEKRFHRVLPSDILYIEGLGNYITIYLKNHKSLISYMTLKEAESMLDFNFRRIHKSYVINHREIDSYNTENVVIGDRVIPIGKTYEI